MAHQGPVSGSLRVAQHARRAGREPGFPSKGMSVLFSSSLLPSRLRCLLAIHSLPRTNCFSPPHREHPREGQLVQEWIPVLFPRRIDESAQCTRTRRCAIRQRMRKISGFYLRLAIRDAETRGPDWLLGCGADSWHCCVYIHTSEHGTVWSSFDGRGGEAMTAVICAGNQFER